MTYEEIVRFHGHECPGVTIGYRMAKAGMESLAAVRSEDEELVAIVENDACGVDAVQCMTGCTFGKGNLKFRDFGKHVYTFYSRKSGEGVRVLLHGKGIPEGMRENRAEFTKWLMSAPNDAMLSVSSVSIREPEPARIRKSAVCAFCGEAAMESRIREVNGKPSCIPCAGDR